MKKIILASALSCMLLFSSCATVFTGSKRKVMFETNPAGATLLVNGVERCTTPCDWKVSVEDDIRFSLDGYSERVVIMDSKFNLVAILNGFSILGWGIDALSGSLKRVDTKYMKLDLKKQDVATLETAMNNGSIKKIDISSDKKVIETVIVLND